MNRKEYRDMIKQLYTTLMSLAFGFAIALFWNYHNSPDCSQIALLILLLVTITRYYHGNMAILSISGQDRIHFPSIRLYHLLDFSLGLSVIALFYPLSHFVTAPRNFLSFLIVMLIADIFWNLLGILHEGKRRRLSLSWLIIDSVVLVCGVVLALCGLQNDTLTWALVVMLGFDTFADYLYNSKYYFPDKIES